MQALWAFGFMTSLQLAISLFAALAAVARPAAAATEAPKFESMKFVRVVSADPRCAPDCPEWIAAEGKIEIGTAAAFQKFVASLGGRRLPILINSPGGSAADGIAIGRLIRAKRLAVAVASTTLIPCTEKNPSACGSAEGDADAMRAYCASACTFVLAGGVERFANPLAQIGVHQTLTQFTQTRIYRQFRVSYRIVDGVKHEISRELISEKRTQSTSKQAAMPQTESTVASWFREAGVGQELETIALTAPPSGIHWLTAQEKTSTHLITAWIDQKSAIVGGLGAGGLAGVATAANPTANPIFSARGEWPLALPVQGRTVFLGVDLLYRRGGGGVETTVHTRTQESERATDEPGDVRGVGFSFRARPDGGEYRVVKTFNREHWSAITPRADFCKLAGSANWLVEPYDDPANQMPVTTDNPHEPPIVIETAKLEGFTALVEEACAPTPPRGKS